MTTEVLLLDDEADIIENIQKIRSHRRISQKGLAVSAGIDPKRMNRIEVKRRGLRVDELIRVARALGVSVDYLIEKKLELG